MTQLFAQASRPVWLMPPIQWGFGAAIAILLSLWQAGLFQQELLNPGGWEQFWRFWRASIHPELTAEMVRLTIDASLTTLAYAVCGTVLTILLGMVGGIFASEVWWRSIVPQHKSSQISPWWLSVRFLLAVPRAIHEMIWGLFFVNLWGLDPLTAVLAIAIPFGAITAKVFSEILDETPRQPLQSLLNSGVAAPVAFAYSLLPQAFLNLLSYSFYRFECSLRSAAVLGIIGAGGLGYQIFLSLQSLNYEQLWTFFYALVVLNGAVDFTSAWLRQQLGCTSRLDLNLKHRNPLLPPDSSLLTPDSSLLTPDSSLLTLKSKIQTPLAKRREALFKIPPRLTLAIISVLLLPFCFWYVRADYRKLWAPRTRQLLAEIGRASFPPDWSGVQQLPWLSMQTVAMSVLAIALAASIGMALSFPAAHNFFLPGGLLNRGRQSQISLCLSWAMLLFARLFLLVCRAIPAPIWALVMLFILFPGILPGAIALGIHNLGILGRLKAEVIENLDFRPLEALKTQGAPGSLVFLYGVLPMTLPRFVAYDLYRWEVCMRETVIVGLVGAGGLGRLLTEQLSSFDYRSLVVTLAGFVLLTFGVDWVSAQMRRSLR